ncbi:HAD-IA family hydrolase, partial [Salmonella enterica subsp. enterica serovar Kentucky]|nr:HAD-IA family hydrolase [Salmonella enterica subsp. enterica serovar Kentucky]
PDPALMLHAANAMKVNVEKCILVDDSSAGAQSGIAAGMEVFYWYAVTPPQSTHRLFCVLGVANDAPPPRCCFAGPSTPENALVVG